MPRSRTLLALVLMVTVLAHKQAFADGDGAVPPQPQPGWAAGLDEALADFPVATPPAPGPSARGDQPGRPLKTDFATGLDRLMGGPGRAPGAAQTAAR